MVTKPYPLDEEEYDKFLNRYGKEILDKFLSRYKKDILDKFLNRYEKAILDKFLNRYGEDILAKFLNRYGEDILAKFKNSDKKPAPNSNFTPFTTFFFGLLFGVVFFFTQQKYIFSDSRNISEKSTKTEQCFCCPAETQSPDKSTKAEQCFYYR